MFQKIAPGTFHPAVSPLKKILNSLTNSRLQESNFFDENTYLAVKFFQHRHKSPSVNGIIDEKTLYNLLANADSRQINEAILKNSIFKKMVSNLRLPYDDEVHKGLTSILAMAAGFHYTDAETIANNDVGIDYNPRTQPMPASAYDVVSGENCERLKRWHFVTPERLKELDDLWRKDGDPAQLGAYLHVFQDSFSHRDLGSCFGQMGTRVDENGNMRRDALNPFKTEVWHEVDDPSKRPQLAFEMAKQTYDILVGARPIAEKNRKVVKSFFLTPWNSIKDEVWQFCTEKNRDKRKDIIVKLYSSLRNAQISYEKKKSV